MSNPTTKQGNRTIDLTGHVFGKLTVVERVPSTKHHTMWRCVCACSRETIVGSDMLRGGKTRSCGCLKNEPAHNKTHGMAGTPEYGAWANMRSRCINTGDKAYANYGGRGIRVCDRWMDSFENFLSDMGKRPSAQHSLDRIDNDGPYSPENCRWATRGKQQNNRRNTKFITYGGETKAVAEWAAITGISDETLRNRIRLGYSDERIFKRTGR